jgi:hypothetical protein
VIKLVTVGLVLFLIFALVVSLFQNRILFPTHMVGRPGPLPHGTQRLGLNTPDGYRLQGVHIPPSRDGGERLLIVAFAGNAWNSADAADYLSEVYPEAHIVAFHYRGYAPSTGSPSTEALMADAPLIYDAATARVKPQRTIAVPGRRTDALRRRVPNLVFDRTIEGVGHNDIYHTTALHEAMSDALAALSK